MRFEQPLIPGTLIKRYKRFLTDVTLATGEVVCAHCANPGSMLSVNAAGSAVMLSPSTNPERKLRYSWEMIRVGTSWVGINTARPNAIVEEAINKGAIEELAGYATLRREVKYGKNSRIDILLEDPARPPCYVEVKNVTMRRDLTEGAPAEFPDAVTARGAKHLEELSDMVKKGFRAVMFYLVQRQDADGLTIAADIDPTYAEGLKRARKAGVEVLSYACRIGPDEIAVDRPMALRL